ncbi:uncharacterized protein LOC114734120 isoform X2 [Neltuma alba]|uniref:uncharacterized protein LOC114734120 isoform X2 n=1 Tax=Neltuma alba TaxID=207710 RepID=UPI0010A585D8|nr:uncharacterized protein LOC114734120 isoform X2 [Prosopis alba]
MYRFAFLLLTISATLFPLLSITFSAEPVDDFISQLHQAKFRIAQLESTLEENNQKLSERSLYLKECEKRIDEMSEKIHDLQSTLSSIKADSFHAEKGLKALEEEVQLLWANSRKNNFDLHILESKAQDAEKRLKEVTSVVEKIGDIVTEQWIQVQHLEQALHITEMRTMKARRLGGFTSILDDFRAVQSYLFGDRSTTNSLISQATNQMKRCFLLAKTYHHQLQAFIKDLMKRHKLTAAFANDELVFFLASALITFPVMSAWMLLSSRT